MLATLDPVLLDLAKVFGLCVGVAALFHRLRMPPIVGYLAAGALAGPNALALVQHPELVEQLSEVGVVVLLFTVGMELSLRRLFEMRRQVLIGGGLQLVLTIGLGALAAFAGGQPPGRALFLGFLLALSSTAAVTKLITDRGEFSSPHGRLSVSICVAQDLAVVPMIVAMPLLAGGGEDVTLAEQAADTLWTFGLLAVVLAVALVVIPRVLDLVGRTRSRELFVLTVIALCLAMAAATAELGMSLAIGAFLAGLILAETDYHHQATSEVEPFRDALASLFFVSIGMLFDVGIVIEAPFAVVAGLLAVVVGKAAIVLVAAKAVGLPGWFGLRSALTLAQVGEFSFVLVQLGGGLDLLDDRLEKLFLLLAVLSIAATPGLHTLGRRLAQRAPGSAAREPAGDPTAGHAVVVGYGPVGRTVAEALRSVGIPLRAVEMNPATVKAEKAKGVPIFLGDSTRSVVMHAAGIERARLLVITINDPVAARRTASLARRLAPHVHIVSRAVYLGEVALLEKAGADEVVPQELETSVEVLVRVLRHFLVADDEVGRQVRQVREQVGRGRAAAAHARLSAALAEHLPGLGVQVFKAETGAALSGHTLAESGLRKATGCTVVALRRGTRTITAPGPEEEVEAGDVAVVLGPEARLPEAAARFRAPVGGDERGPAEEGTDGGR